MYRKKEREENKMGYKGTRKVEATFYINKEKTETRTMIQTFTSYTESIEKSRKSLTSQVERYADNPYMIEVKNISEYFESMF